MQEIVHFKKKNNKKNVIIQFVLWFFFFILQYLENAISFNLNYEVEFQCSNFSEVETIVYAPYTFQQWAIQSLQMNTPVQYCPATFYCIGSKDGLTRGCVAQLHSSRFLYLIAYQERWEGESYLPRISLKSWIKRDSLQYQLFPENKIVHLIHQLECSKQG